METRPIIALYAETHDVIKDEDSLLKRRELAFALLEEKDVCIITDFSPTTAYLKEVLVEKDNVISFSPAVNKEEHVSVYKLPLLPKETVIYTGLGNHHVKALLLQNAHVVMALDENAFKEASIVVEKTGARVFLLNGIGKKNTKTYFESE